MRSKCSLCPNKKTVLGWTQPSREMNVCRECFNFMFEAGDFFYCHECKQLELERSRFTGNGGLRYCKDCYTKVNEK